MTVPAPKPSTNPTSHHRYLSDDDEHEKYAPVGIDGLLAASEKLLAVNRGLAEPDERDSLPNDRIHTVDRLMAELKSDKPGPGELMALALAGHIKPEDLS